MSDVLWFRPDTTNERVVTPTYVVRKMIEMEERVNLLEKASDLDRSLNSIKTNQILERIQGLEERNVPQLNFSEVRQISVFNRYGEILLSVPEESGVAKVQ
uniref:Uncharacterized protein n=1 Tax=viral metagenome TaxID=1070528 RepID=A0A6H2A0K9_9ZZZZ